MRIRYTIICLAVGLICTGTFGQSTKSIQQQNSSIPQSSVLSKFNWKDVFKIKRVSEPQLSADGQYLLYVRSLPDGLNDTRKTYLWIVNIRTGEQHQWSKGMASSPSWLPDGAHISYRAPGSNGQWNYYVGTVEHPQETMLALPSDAGNVTWSPDSRYVAFTRFVAEPKATLGLRFPKPDSVKWAEPARIFMQKHFFSDGPGETPAGFTQIFMMAASGGAPKQLTSGPYNNNSGFAWTPDSKFIVFSSARGKDWESHYYNEDLYRLQVNNGALKQLTSFPYGIRQPVVSPDGKYIAFTGTTQNKKDYEQGELYVVNADGLGLQALSKSLDREISDFRWASDGKHILATYDDHGITKLGKFGLEDDIQILAEQLDDDFASSNNGLLAFALIRDGKPSDIFLRVPNGKLRQLTHENDSLFSQVKTGSVRALPVKSSIDGAEVGSWLTLPPDYDATKRYPLILSIHGGPHGSVGPNWSNEDQLFASAGYVVLKVNYRGSTSYGFAFADKTYSNFPGPAYDDLMSAVDAAIASGVADPNRLFATGGSAGGQLTAWIVGKTNRFKAVAAVKPVINQLAMALSNDQYASSIYYEFAKSLWEDPLAYWKSSPLSLADKVTTPTLLLVGEDDRRTPVSESVQFYHALQLRNIPTALAIVPHASHGTLDSKPSQRINDAYIILDWFGRYGGIPLKDIVSEKNE